MPLPVICDAARDSLRRRRCSGIFSINASEGSLDPRSGEQVGGTVRASPRSFVKVRCHASLLYIHFHHGMGVRLHLRIEPLSVCLAASSGSPTHLAPQGGSNRLLSRNCINDLVTRSHRPFAVALHPLEFTPATSPTLNSGNDFLKNSINFQDMRQEKISRSRSN